MKILAIDTSSTVGSIALTDGELLRARSALNIRSTHNRRLLPGIDRILGDVGWSLDDLDGLGVTLGPGSFTGLRIGMSVMKGLAWATGKPLAGISTLDALAVNVSPVPYQICPLLDARKGEIYTALYRWQDDRTPERLTPFMVIKPEDLGGLLTEKTFLLGDGLLRYRDYLAGVLGVRMVQAPAHLNFVDASAVAWLAGLRLERGLAEDVSNCTPIYVRSSEAELSRRAGK